jgi:hypothetical protein
MRSSPEDPDRKGAHPCALNASPPATRTTSPSRSLVPPFRSPGPYSKPRSRAMPVPASRYRTQARCLGRSPTRRSRCPCLSRRGFRSRRSPSCPATSTFATAAGHYRSGLARRAWSAPSGSTVAPGTSSSVATCTTIRRPLRTSTLPVPRSWRTPHPAPLASPPPRGLSPPRREPFRSRSSPGSPSTPGPTTSRT